MTAYSVTCSYPNTVCLYKITKMSAPPPSYKRSLKKSKTVWVPGTNVQNILTLRMNGCKITG